MPKLMSLTKLLNMYGSALSAAVIFKVLERTGLIDYVHYDSLSHSGQTKSFKALVKDGLKLGENKPSWRHPAKTEMYFYPEKLTLILEICRDYFASEVEKLNKGEIIFEELPESLSDKQESTDQLSGKTYVVTGTLAGMGRDQAKTYLQQLGAKVAGSVSAKTTALVAGEKAGSKLTKAQDLGVSILDEPLFIALLEEHGIHHDD